METLGVCRQTLVKYAQELGAFLTPGGHRRYDRTKVEAFRQRRVGRDMEAVRREAFKEIEDHYARQRAEQQQQLAARLLAATQP